MRIPFPFLQSLEPVDRNRLERNFAEIEKFANNLATASSYFDATVDPTATTDDTANRVFTTPYAAVEYCADTLGLRHPIIGIWPNRTASANTTCTETANLTLTTVPGQVTLVGMSGKLGVEGELTAGGVLRWDIGDTTSPAGVTWNLYNIDLRRGSGTKAYLLGTSTAAVAPINAYNCRISGEHITGGITLGETFGYRTVYQRCITFAGDSVVFDSCVIYANTTSNVSVLFGNNAAATIFLARNTTFVANASTGVVTWTARGSTTLVAPIFTKVWWGGSGSGPTPTFAVTSVVTRVNIIGAHAYDAPGAGCDLTLSGSSSLIDVRISGNFNSVTIPALASTSEAVLDVQIGSTVASDISGPCSGRIAAVAARTGTQLTLRGSSCNVDVSLAAGASGAALLAMVDLVDSIVRYVARSSAASTTQPPYSIDAGCARDTIIVEKENITWAAATNAGTAINIIDHTGSGIGVVGDQPSRILLGPFYQENVTASQTNVQLNVFDGGGATPRDYVLPVRAGSITGVVVRTSTGRTAGTLTVEPTVNAAGTGLTAVLNGTNTITKATTQAAGSDTFVAGDKLGVRITTDGTWAPTTDDIEVYIEVVQ